MAANRLYQLLEVMKLLEDQILNTQNVDSRESDLLI